MNLHLRLVLPLSPSTVNGVAAPRTSRSFLKLLQAGNMTWAAFSFLTKLNSSQLNKSKKWFWIFSTTSLAACRPKPYLYKNDHTYPGVNKTDAPVVILYAEIGTKRFSSFHQVLSEKAEEGALIYVLRHFVAVSIVFHWFYPKLGLTGG